MAYRLLSHHRMRFSPEYVAGTASVLTKMARRALSLDVTSPKDFEEKVLQSKTPVVIDFHASWCQPCKILAPRLKSVLEAYEGKVDLVKVDVDVLQDLALEYGVMSVPTVIAIKDGEIVDTFIGAKNETEIREFVEKLVVE